MKEEWMAWKKKRLRKPRLDRVGKILRKGDVRTINNKATYNQCMDEIEKRPVCINRNTGRGIVDDFGINKI